MNNDEEKSYNVIELLNFYKEFIKQYEVMYHPYVPLQMVNLYDLMNDKQIKFITRYEKDNNE